MAIELINDIILSNQTLFLLDISGILKGEEGDDVLNDLRNIVKNIVFNKIYKDIKERFIAGKEPRDCIENAILDLESIKQDGDRSLKILLNDKLLDEVISMINSIYHG